MSRRWRLAAALFGVYVASAIAAAIVAGCAARGPAGPAPAPALLLNYTLPDNARLCVPRETFRYAGFVCITVGELRVLLRSRRSVAFEVGS